MSTTSIDGGYRFSFTDGGDVPRLVETAGRKQSLLLAYAT